MSEPDPSKTPTTRVDLLLIADMVTEGSRVLDIGCGDGALLKLLSEKKNIDARGLELSQKGVNQSVAEGLSVIQGDADIDLDDYPDDAFDYVILSRTLQATQRPRHVLENLIRISKKAIVSFPNFAYWRARLYLLFKGRMPMTENLPHVWYETPNIHFCTIHDFIDLCKEVDAEVEQAIALNARGKKLPFNPTSLRLINLIGEQGVFLLKRK